MRVATCTSYRRLTFASSASFHRGRQALANSHLGSASSTRWITILSSEAASDGGDGDGKKARKPKGKGKRKVAGGEAREEMFRLDRLLANRGVGTRTEVTVLIRRGKVKRSDTGEVVK